jgi:hypothetical protein
MELYQRIEQILLQFRPVFRREATFEWFVLLFCGVVLSTQPPAVSRYLNVLGLGGRLLSTGIALASFQRL